MYIISTDHRSALDSDELDDDDDDDDAAPGDVESKWDEVFHTLAKSGPVLSNWRMLCTRLKVPSAKITSIEYDCKRLTDKLSEGLTAWRASCSADNRQSYKRLINALRKEKFNLAAGTSTRLIPSL